MNRESTPRYAKSLVAGVVAFACMALGAAAQPITEIIDTTGDGAGNALIEPYGIAVDGAGNVYVQGFNSNNAFKVTPGGVITEIIDTIGDGAGNALIDPLDIAVDGAGNVFVSGYSSDNAFKIAPGGVITEIIDSSGDGAGNPLSFPYAIAVDGVGNVYVSGALSSNAFEITPGGVITEIIDSSGDGAGNPLSIVYGIAVDGAGNVYIPGYTSDNAFKVTPGGVITEIIDSSGDGAGNTLNAPYGIAVDGAGNVYVAGSQSANAFEITPGGVITEIIDSSGDGAGNPLNGPYGIAVDGAGNVYVSGVFSNNAFKITPGGVITEIIDSSGDGAGKTLNGPYDIAVDGAGNVYVPGRNTSNAFKVGDAPFPVPLPDHYLCYDAKEESGTPKFEPILVNLQDQFGTFVDVEVKKPRAFCNAVDKNGEGIGDETAHLTCYDVKQASGTPKLPKTVVQTDDQFGVLTLKRGSKAKTLCVPSEKGGTPSDLRVDHFQWYTVKEESGEPKFEEVLVDLRHEFGTFLDVEVEKPTHLGTPTDKNGQGILNEESHLTCYDVKQASGTPKLPKYVVEILNQFGDLTLQLGSKPKTLCLPATKEVISME